MELQSFTGMIGICSREMVMHGTAFRYRYVAERHSFCIDSQQEPRNSLERTSVVDDLLCIQEAQLVMSNS